MADNLTPNELEFQKKFLQQMEAAETASAQEKALKQSIIAAVNTVLEQPGEATTKDIFGAIQQVVDDVRTDMDQKVGQIEKDLPAKRQELARAKVSRKISIGPKGAAESLTNTANALQSTLSEANLKAIVKSAEDAQLQAGTTSLSLETNYEANVVTELDNSVLFKNVKSASRNDVIGNVHRRTEKHFAQEGKLNPRYDFKTPGNIHEKDYKYSTFIVRGDLTKNSVHEWDTLDLIAASWLQNNKNAKIFLPEVSNGKETIPATTLTSGKNGNREFLTHWLVIANDLRQANGKACDGTTFTGAMIHEGQRLALPTGNKPTPQQAYMVCTVCEIETSERPTHIAVGTKVDISNNPPPPPVMLRMPEFQREFIRQNAQSMEGGVYRQGSTELAIEVGAQAGFNDAHYRIPQNVARDPVLKSKRSGEATPTYEGKHLIGDNIKKDDGFKNYKTNGNNLLEDIAFGYRSRIYTPGHGEYDVPLAVVSKNGKLLSVQIDETGAPVQVEKGKGGEYVPVAKPVAAELLEAGKDGKPVVVAVGTGDVLKPVEIKDGKPAFADPADADGFYRDTKKDWYKSHSAKAPATTVLGVRVPLPFMFGTSYTAPADQEVTMGLTRREGITSSRTTGSVFDPEGRAVVFRNEYAKVTDEFTDPSRMNANTAKKSVEREFDKAITQLQNPALDAEAKQANAKTALIALRDHSENMLEYRVDAADLPGARRYEAARAFMLKQGVSEDYITKVEQELKSDTIDPSTSDYVKNPRLPIRYMDEAQLLAQIDYKSDPTRFPDKSLCGQPIPGANTPQFRKDAYQTVTYFGQEIATGKHKDAEEAAVVPAARAVWEKVSKNPEAVKTVADFVTTDRNARITMSELLHDLNRNPQEYFTKEEVKNGTAQKTLEAFIGDGKEPKDQTEGQKKLNAWREEARNDVLRRGGTSPILFVKDGRQPNSQPALVAKLLDEKRKENPAAFEEALGKLLDRMSDPAHGVDSKGKNNGYRYSVGLLRDYGAEQVSWGQRDGTLPPSFEKLSTALGGDEETTKALKQTVIDVVNYNETAASKRSSQGMQLLDNHFKRAQEQKLGNQETFDLITSDKKSNQVTVLGLQDQMLGRDAILATIYKHPEVFSKLGDKLVANGSPKFDGLQDAIDDSKKAFAKYKKTNKPEDLQKGVQEFGDFFVHMAAKSTKRTGMVDERDWQNLVITVANDEAMNKALIETVGGDSKLRDAFTRNAYNAIRTAEDANHTNFVDVRTEAKVKPLKQDTENLQALQGAGAYSSQFFTVEANKAKHAAASTAQSDGSHVTQLKQGTLTEKADGSVSLVDTKKRIVTLNADKSVSVQEADGAIRLVDAQTASKELSKDLAKLNAAKLEAVSDRKSAEIEASKVDYRKGFLGLGGKNHVTQTDEQQVNFLRAIDAKDGTALAKTDKKHKDVVTKNKDGSVTTTHADGTSDTKQKDGTVVTRVNGAEIYKLQDGSTYTRSANGTLITEKSDGSVSLLRADGTTITRNGDQTVSFQEKDGAIRLLQAADANKELGGALAELDAAKLQAASLRQLTGKSGTLNRATLEADEKLLSARAQAASVAFNLGGTTEGNVHHDNPIITLSKQDQAKLNAAKTPAEKLEVAAQLIVDRATTNAGGPEKLNQLSGGLNALDGAKALIVGNHVSLQSEEGMLLTSESFGLQSSEKLSEQGKAGNISTAWLLLGLGFLGGKKTIITEIIDCPGCQPIPLPSNPITNPNLPGR